ncbi:hypothetical protein [Methanobrevibacter olleyae]|uniref:Uncharacterized protein n=1 Tax=Methanobrevibacter olleyae TaxID=294671 RepID=A0A126R192_METOL|nr:hypothetical protein [Methanobrevibacter olleyae]AMK16153.1 hypothetical protein YLM1_1598 [Methanobrevibacter olleyae]SFL31882.1 hypothetical protein SAMN02910297_00555 [Methanobrevibacter olleyae]
MSYRSSNFRNSKTLSIEGEDLIVESRKEEKALKVANETIDELKDYDISLELRCC